MNIFIFINIIFTALNILLFAYCYSLNFFSEKIKKKWNQDLLVGLSIIFFTMITCFLWVFYFYFLIFN